MPARQELEVTNQDGEHLPDERRASAMDFNGEAVLGGRYAESCGPRETRQVAAQFIGALKSPLS